MDQLEICKILRGMQKAGIFNLLFLIGICFSCNSKISNGSNDEIWPKENEISLFEKVAFLDSSRIQNDIFFKLSDSIFSFNGSKYKLFRLYLSGESLTGYWGLRNDSLLFIPSGFETCPIEYLICDLSNSGNFYTDYSNNCFIHKGLGFGNGYSFFVDSISSNVINVGQFVNPGYGVEVDFQDHLREINFLSMNLSLDHGILCFNYNLFNDSIYTIPWVLLDSKKGFLIH